MGRIRPLPSPRFQHPRLSALPEKTLQQLHFGLACNEARAKLAEYGKVEAGIRKLKPQQIFPIDASAHGFGGLAVRETFAKLENSDECQTPRWECRLAAGRKECRKIIVTVESTQFVTQGQIGRTLGKGGVCNLSRLLRNRLDETRMKRYGDTRAKVW
jgi:hypothetical protein